MRSPKYNCRFNEDADKGHAFVILMALVGAMRT